MSSQNKTPNKSETSNKLYHCPLARYDSALAATLNFNLQRGGMIPRSLNAQQDFPVVNFVNEIPVAGDLVSVTFLIDTGSNGKQRRVVRVYRLPDTDQTKSCEYRLTGAFFEHYIPDAVHRAPIIENSENKRFRVFGDALPSKNSKYRDKIDTFIICIAKNEKLLSIRCGDQAKEC